MKIVVGITGATGVIYGIKLLKKLKTHPEVSTVLAMSEWAEKTIALETDYTAEYVRSLADEVCSNGNMAEGISGGSYKVDATVIIPCTVKTLSAIAHGYDAELIVRAADVALKEHRKLIICPHETPLNEIHFENMAKLARMGAYIVPPMPSFYHRPQNADDIVEQFACRVMELCGIKDAAYRRWKN